MDPVGTGSSEGSGSPRAQRAFTTLPRRRPSVARRLVILLGDLKVLNTAFSLPLAYIGMLLASAGTPSWQQVLWVTAAVVGARTFGFAINQLADRDLDALHPSKQSRALPAGLITEAEMLGVAGGAAGLFLLSAYQLNMLAFLLAPVVLGYLVFYSQTKRFVWATQLFMGPTTGGAIAGGWIGVTGSIGWEPTYLLAAASAWVVGFDLMVATPDYDFDIQQGLHSMVRKWGVGAALWISRGFYAAAAILFLGMGLLFQLGPLFYPFWGASVATLIVQHRLFDPTDLERGHRILFRLSAPYSLLLLMGVLLGLGV